MPTAKPTLSKTENAIRILSDLEQRGRELRNQLDAIELRWGKHYEAVRGTPEWRERCDKAGVCRHYNFGDVIA